MALKVALDSPFGGTHLRVVSMAIPSVPPASQREPASRKTARRILFVDDDELILRSIERVLRRPALESGWELCFATNGAAALDEMSRAAIEVILVDSSMGKMSGSVLLRRVQERDPSVVRIMLSGDTGFDVLRTALPYAHQFLPKPCDGQLLRSTLESACGVRSLLERPEMRRLVGASSDLPAAPRTFVELSTALSNPSSDARAVSEIVDRDLATSTRVMALVSSAYRDLPQSVASIGGAVAYLGVEVVKALVLSVEVSQMFPLTQSIPDFSTNALQKRGVRVSQFAKRIIDDEPADEALLVAGLLQDIGQFVLASRAAPCFALALSTSERLRQPLHKVEHELFGASHAEVGAYLLGLWGLPQGVVTAVANHLEPQRTPSRVFDAAAALYVANHLLADPEVPALEEVPPGTVALDLVYLRLIGVAPRLEEWRLLARAFGTVSQAWKPIAHS